MSTRTHTRIPTHASSSARARMGTPPLVAIVAAALLMVVLGSCSQPEHIALDCIGPRTDVVSVSSSERSAHFVDGSAEVLTRDLAAAAVCDEPFVAIAVAGAGTETIVDRSDIASLGIDVPSMKARRHRVQGRLGEIRALVKGHLADALRAMPPGRVSSVPRLFDVAAEHATNAKGRVLIRTDGVQSDAGVDLNRVLAAGEGTRLVSKVTVAHLPAKVRVTVDGIGQVDAKHPAPGVTWIREVTAFNRELCRATGAKCRVSSSATSAEAVR